MKKKVVAPKKKEAPLATPEASKGNPFGQVLEVPKEPETSDGLCECGAPVAEGQNKVCKAHIRAS